MTEQHQDQTQTGRNASNRVIFNNAPSTSIDLSGGDDDESERITPLCPIICVFQSLSDLPKKCKLDETKKVFCFCPTSLCGPSDAFNEHFKGKNNALIVGPFCDYHNFVTSGLVHTLFVTNNKIDLCPVSVNSYSQRTQIFPILCMQPINSTAKSFHNILSQTGKTYPDLEDLTKLLAICTIGFSDGSNYDTNIKDITMHLVEFFMTWSSEITSILGCLDGAKVTVFLTKEYYSTVRNNKWIVTHIAPPTDEYTAMEIPLIDFPLFDLLNILKYLPAYPLNYNSKNPEENFGVIPNIEIINGWITYGCNFGMPHRLFTQNLVINTTGFQQDVRNIVSNRTILSNYDVMRLAYASNVNAILPVQPYTSPQCDVVSLKAKLFKYQ